MDFQRLPNETDEQLFLRVCSCKDSIGSWSKVAEVLNGLLNNNFDESTYRKRYKEFNRIDEAVLNAQNNAFDFDRKHKVLLDDIRKERIKLQTVNAERNRLDRAEARQELFYEQVGQFVKTVEPPVFKELQTERSKTQYLLCLSDIHYNADFKSINNTYSPAIAVERFSKIIEYVKNFTEEKHIRKIKILELGDTIQGMIHLNDLRINDSSFVKSIVDASRLIAEFLNELSQYVRVDYYHVPTSNHSQIRAFNAKRNEMPSEDVEYIIGHYIHDLLVTNPRVTVTLADEGRDYISFNMGDQVVYGLHGHTVKNIDSIMAEISAITTDLPDFVFMGHYHSQKEITVSEIHGSDYSYDTEVIICPSFVGSDPYADSLWKGSTAAVNIYGINDKNGHVETYKIVLN